jgi:hypothetical protein
VNSYDSTYEIAHFQPIHPNIAMKAAAFKDMVCLSTEDMVGFSLKGIN